MTGTLPFLSLLILLPFLGAAGTIFFPKKAAQIALGASLLVFGFSLAVLMRFDSAQTTFQLIEKYDWLPSLGISCFLGVDGVSMAMILLTTSLAPFCLVAGASIKDRGSSFYSLFLLLETVILGVFSALDLVLFYVFFEGVLIPLFLIIGLFGGEKRVAAAMKFFLYSFVGSVLMLAAIFLLAKTGGTTDMIALMDAKISKSTALLIWGGFFASFAIKTPLWPFHTWLPDAHGEAPTAGSMILAGVLLKLGLYGFIRIGMQILPEAQGELATYLVVLAVVGILYTSLVALVQNDFKRLIAYTSIAHMGYAICGVASGHEAGLSGAMLIALSHGLVASGLFFGAGVLYDRLHTRELDRLGGVAHVMPRYAFSFMVLTLAALGLPGTSGFVGEFLALLGLFSTHPYAAFWAAFGLVLGAACVLRLYARVFYGSVSKDEIATLADLSSREKLVFAPLVVFVFVLGLYPAPFQAVFEPTTTAITKVYQAKAGAKPLSQIKRIHDAPHDGDTP